MKNYTCETCGEGILLEPREVQDIGAYCTEHLFSEHLTALNELADLASEQEKRSGDLRQDTNRTASTETPERDSVMSDSTTRRAEQNHSDEPPQVKDALNRWAEGKATFGDLMLASQEAGVDPGPVMQKAMKSTFTEEQIEFLQQEDDQ